MTTIVRPDLVPNHHVDVVCPPNQDAECANCGDALRFHWVESLDIAKDVGAVCPNTYGDVFALAGGEDLDCPRVITCEVCDVDLCDEHSSEFTHVGQTGHTHHRDCAWACGDCREQLRILDDAGWSLS